MSDAIAWLRQQVAKSTPEDRKAAYKMADMGDLNEGYIASLLEAACALLAERDEVGARVVALEDERSEILRSFHGHCPACAQVWHDEEADR